MDCGPVRSIKVRTQIAERSSPMVGTEQATSPLKLRAMPSAIAQEHRMLPRWTSAPRKQECGPLTPRPLDGSKGVM